HYPHVADLVRALSLFQAVCRRVQAQARSPQRPPREREAGWGGCLPRPFSDISPPSDDRPELPASLRSRWAQSLLNPLPERKVVGIVNRCRTLTTSVPIVIPSNWVAPARGQTASRFTPAFFEFSTALSAASFIMRSSLRRAVFATSSRWALTWT